MLARRMQQVAVIRAVATAAARGPAWRAAETVRPLTDHGALASLRGGTLLCPCVRTASQATDAFMASQTLEYSMQTGLDLPELRRCGICLEDTRDARSFCKWLAQWIAIHVVVHRCRLAAAARIPRPLHRSISSLYIGAYPPFTQTLEIKEQTGDERGSQATGCLSGLEGEAKQRGSSAGPCG